MNMGAHPAPREFTTPALGMTEEAALSCKDSEHSPLQTPCLSPRPPPPPQDQRPLKGRFWIFAQ